MSITESPPDVATGELALGTGKGDELLVFHVVALVGRRVECGLVERPAAFGFDRFVNGGIQAVLGGGWDTQLSDDPEAFYSITPWRYLDGSQNLQIYVMVTEDHTLVRNVDPDAATSWLSYRHPDIDLQADLKAMCCSGAVGEMCEMAQHCVIWCALLGVSTSRVTGRRITRQLNWAGVPNTPGGLSSVAPAHGDWEALVARPGREPSQRSPP